MIQDYVFLVGGLVLLVGLAPTLTNRRSRVPLRSSLPIGIVVFIFGLCQLSLGLPLAAATNFIQALVWGAIAKCRRA